MTMTSDLITTWERLQIQTRGWVQGYHSHRRRDTRPEADSPVGRRPRSETSGVRDQHPTVFEKERGHFVLQRESKVGKTILKRQRVKDRERWVDTQLVLMTVGQ